MFKSLARGTCATRALMAASDLPEGTLLFVNVTPKTLELDSGANEWLHGGVKRAGLGPGRVVVEVTERIGARTVPVIKSLDLLRSMKALDAQPGTIIQGGQGFELGHPSRQMPTGKPEAIRSEAVVPMPSRVQGRRFAPRRA
jgi:hypothetical protein